LNTQTYTVNIRTGVVNITRVDVSQGDTGRTLAFKLYDGLVPFTPPTGSTVTIVGRKPSGLGFGETCTVSGNTAAVNTTLAMTQESGKFPVELRIESDTRSIGTANFVMHVEPSPHPAGTTDGTTEEARTVLAQCEEYAQIAQEAAESATEDYTEVRSDVDDLTDRVDALESGSGGSGLTDAVKTALMNLVNHVAWDDDDPSGQTYITSLYNALYPPADLVSISAVYTQSGTVYETADLDDLRNDLVVTATYDDSTTQAVTTYTLSGTLTEGTSTITVSYGGKTDTFNVTVSAALADSIWSTPNTMYSAANTASWDSTTGTGTLSNTGSAGWPNMVSQGLLFKYSEVANKTLRFKCDLETTGIVAGNTGQGVIIVAGLFTSANPTNSGSERKASCNVHVYNETGVESVSEVLNVSEMFTGTSLDNYYLGFSMFLNKQGTCSVTISNISAEVS